jgi:hypothetical protein
LGILRGRNKKTSVRSLTRKKRKGGTGSFKEEKRRIQSLGVLRERNK